MWNVTINYHRGIGHQQFVLTQHGAVLSGDQKGGIFNAALHGRVEADHVTLSSAMKANGSQISFDFTGTVSGSSISGDVKMSEYGAGTFKASKA